MQVPDSNPYDCIVMAANCPVSSFRIEVVSYDQASPVTLYLKDISLQSTGDLTSTINSFNLEAPHSAVTSCMSRIQAVSINSATSHNSTYTTSQTLALVAAPTNLLALYTNTSITVVWYQDGTGPNDFDVFVTTVDGQVDISITVTQETAI